MKLLSVIAALILFVFITCEANCSELIFQFVSPSFGGNPLNGSFLLQQAQLQNKFKEKKRKRNLFLNNLNQCIRLNI